MADKEIIINCLQKIERRLRAERLFQELTFGLAVFLIFPLALKIWDLFSPISAAALTVTLVVWLISFGIYAVRGILRKGTLDQVAALVDQRAGLQDEMKTAFWFINHPQPSEWVDVQIRRAAGTVGRLDLNRLYPRTLPRALYIAGGMMLAFVVLNLLPLPWNHNWMAMEAASPSRTAEQEQEELAKQALETARIQQGLQKIAKDLEKSELLKAVAEALKENQLKEAADALRKIAGELGTQNADALQDMQESLKMASENPTEGLEQLSSDLEEAADKLKAGNSQEAMEAMVAMAKDLEKLDEKADKDKLKDLTNDQLEKLAKSLRNRQIGEQTDLEAQIGQDGEAEGEREAAGEDEGGPASKKQAQRNGQPGQTGPGEGTGDDPGDGSAPQGDVPRMGAPTQLEVQLEKQAVASLKDENALKPEEIEEASKQERSRLDYRNVKSELTPAQKDLLNQDRIPWEYRPLIKEYFQAIRPPDKK
jgi:hypothetical protein